MVVSVGWSQLRACVQLYECIWTFIAGAHSYNWIWYSNVKKRKDLESCLLVSNGKNPFPLETSVPISRRWNFKFEPKKNADLSRCLCNNTWTLHTHPSIATTGDIGATAGIAMSYMLSKQLPYSFSLASLNLGNSSLNAMYASHSSTAYSSTAYFLVHSLAVSMAWVSCCNHASATSLASGSLGFGAANSAWMDNKMVLIWSAGDQLFLRTSRQILPSLSMFGW